MRLIALLMLAQLTLNCSSATGRWYLMGRDPDLDEQFGPRSRVEKKYYELDFRSDGTLLGAPMIHSNCYKLRESGVDFYWRLDRNNSMLRAMQSPSQSDESFGRNELYQDYHSIELTCEPGDLLAGMHNSLFLLCKNKLESGNKKCALIGGAGGAGIAALPVWLSRDSKFFEHMGGSPKYSSFSVSGKVVRKGHDLFHFCADGSLKRETTSVRAELDGLHTDIKSQILGKWKESDGIIEMQYEFELQTQPAGAANINRKITEDWRKSFASGEVIDLGIVAKDCEASEFTIASGAVAKKYAEQASSAPNTDADKDLLTAVCKGNMVLVVQALDKGANVNAIESGKDSKEQWTPLSIAVQKNNEKLVKYLIDSGADVDHIVGEDGSSLLMRAATTGRDGSSIKVMTWLLYGGAKKHTSGAKKNMQNRAGKTALDLAEMSRRSQNARFLRNNGGLREVEINLKK
jgi:Ankyrin repeats (3 copies)